MPDTPAAERQQEWVCTCYFDPATQKLIRSPHCEFGNHGAIARGERRKWEPRDDTKGDVPL